MLTVAGSFWVALALPASATEGEMVVTSDTTLMEDHQGDVIIEADGVTLDCDGHTVTGDSVYAITVARLTVGVVVRDCIIDAGSILAVGGQRATNSTPRVLANSTLENNLIIGEGWLIVGGGGGNTIVGNEVIGALDGVFGLGRGFHVDSDVNTFIENTAAGAPYAGFYISEDGDDNVFIGNTSLDNGTGFLVDDPLCCAPQHPSGNVFQSNEAYRNGIFGFDDTSDEFDGGTGTNGTWNRYEDNLCAANGIFINRPHHSQSSPPGLCTVLGEGRFIDDDGDTFEADIEWLAFEDLTKGCDPPENIRYCPDDPVTRGELAVFLDRIFDYSDDEDGDLFVDDDGRFYEGAADRLKTAGITNGCNPPVNDRYCGDRPVTRSEFAALFVRAMGYTDGGGGDLFVDDDHSPFEDAIDKLATAGVTRGCNPPNNHRFCPDNDMTRGQFAAFMHRALD